MAIVTSSQLANAYAACSLNGTSATGGGDILRCQSNDIYSGNQTFQQYYDSNQNDGMAGSLGGHIQYVPTRKPTM